MDNRDQVLIAQVEAGSTDQASLILLIAILSNRRLGPDTINEIPVTDYQIDDPVLITLSNMIDRIECQAFKLLSTSIWYAEDRWPVITVVHVFPEHIPTFREWVNQGLERLDIIDAMKYNREV